MQKWQKKTVIATAVALFLGIFILRSGVNLLYMNHIPADSKPMPAVMHIAMGTNDDKQNAGWFNGYNWNTYEKHDFMPEPAAKEAKEHLLEFAEECVNDSAMAIDFYSRKLGAQWEAPMYQCYVMNIYQILLYGGVFVYLLAGRKKEQQIEHYVLLIGVFGGFLFSAMWEAKARYVFPYLMMMISYAAAGITVCVSWCASGSGSYLYI